MLTTASSGHQLLVINAAKPPEGMPTAVGYEPLGICFRDRMLKAARQEPLAISATAFFMAA